MTQPKVQLLIEINAQGKVEVTGPVHDKFTCYALLEAARDVIKDYGDAAAKSHIQIAPAGAVPDITKDRTLSFNAPLNGRGK